MIKASAWWVNLDQGGFAVAPVMIALILPGATPAAP
jgi:hypothetical protein